VLAQLIVNGLANACVTALMAVGFALIYSPTRIFHLAHGAVYVIAAYAYYLCCPEGMFSAARLWRVELTALFAACVRLFDSFGGDEQS
jgi:branched-chain amino acid transport system permease protein